MMDAGALARNSIRFFVMRDGGAPIGMGGYKRLSELAEGPHGEIKSMHILHEVRGRGLARAMLDHLIVAAGSGSSYFGHDEWQTIAPPMKQLEDALEIRELLLRAMIRAPRPL